MPEEEDEDSSDSDLDLDQDIRGPKEAKKFVQSLKEYKIETELDRKLLTGVLQRDRQQKGETNDQQRPDILQSIYRPQDSIDPWRDSQDD